MTKSNLSPPPSGSDEKTDHAQREYLERDETPGAIDAKKKEDALRRKLDYFVAPVMMMLMLISYLDRGNIGFAATQGMTIDIKLKGSQLNASYAHLREFHDGMLTDTRLPYPCFTSSTF
jgi:hypothetical protein